MDLDKQLKNGHEKFDQVILSNGFCYNEYDKYMHINGDMHSYVIVYLYVDDMIITDSTVALIKELKNRLARKFDIMLLLVLKSLKHLMDIMI